VDSLQGIIVITSNTSGGKTFASAVDRELLMDEKEDYAYRTSNGDPLTLALSETIVSTMDARRSCCRSISTGSELPS